MINSYYFDDNNAEEYLKEKRVVLPKNLKGPLEALTELLKEEYNLPFKDFLDEAKLTPELFVEEFAKDGVDAAAFAMHYLEDFYFKHQRVWASLV